MIRVENQSMGASVLMTATPVHDRDHKVLQLYSRHPSGVHSVVPMKCINTFRTMTPFRALRTIQVMYLGLDNVMGYKEHLQ